MLTTHTCRPRYDVRVGVVLLHGDKLFVAPILHGHVNVVLVEAENESAAVIVERHTPHLKRFLQCVKQGHIVACELLYLIDPFVTEQGVLYLDTVVNARLLERRFEPCHKLRQRAEELHACGIGVILFSRIRYRAVHHIVEIRLCHHVPFGVHLHLILLIPIRACAFQ